MMLMLLHVSATVFTSVVDILLEFVIQVGNNRAGGAAETCMEIRTLLVWSSLLTHV